MFTEDFCSYGVAQLLKEKGFDELCIFKYNSEGVRMKAGVAIDEWQNSELDDDEYSCPSQSMAMKWLREKGIEIIVYPFSNIVKENMLYTADICTSIVTRQQGHLRGMWKTYEEAVEAALKYTLENLL